MTTWMTAADPRPILFLANDGHRPNRAITIWRRLAGSAKDTNVVCIASGLGEDKTPAAARRRMLSWLPRSLIDAPHGIRLWVGNTTHAIGRALSHGSSLVVVPWRMRAQAIDAWVGEKRAHSLLLLGDTEAVSQLEVVTGIDRTELAPLQTGVLMKDDLPVRASVCVDFDLEPYAGEIAPRDAVARKWVDAKLESISAQFPVGSIPIRSVPESYCRYVGRSLAGRDGITCISSLEAKGTRRVIQALRTAPGSALLVH